MASAFELFEAIIARISSLRGLVWGFQLELDDGSDICLKQAAYSAAHIACASAKIHTSQEVCHNYNHMTYCNSMKLLHSVLSLAYSKQLEEKGV